MLAEEIWKKFYKSLKKEDIICLNCEFNFDGICSAHESFYGYGNEINDFKKVCSEWNPSLFFFDTRIKEIEKSEGRISSCMK